MSTILKKQKKGFTLIELIVVIAILALLAAIALPKYMQSRERSALVAHNSNVRILEAAAQNYLANGGTDTTWPSNSSYTEYVQKWPKTPSGLDKFGISANKEYTVTIQKGQVSVSPGSIDEKL